MHFIKLSSENVYIYTYFNVHRRLISMVSLTSFFQSLIYTQTHMSYRVLFFVCLRSIHYDDHAILDLYIYIYLSICDAYRESRRRQVSHDVYLLEGIASPHLEKHIYTHTCTRMWWHTNTDDYIIHLCNPFPIYLWLWSIEDNRTFIVQICLFRYGQRSTTTTKK
jgi:hypothetical protein